MIDERWQQAYRVLAVRLDNLGDVLLTTPALHAIKESLPHTSLTLLTSSVGAQIGHLNPDVDEVIAYEAPWIDPWCRLPHDSAREQAVIRELKAGGFDGAIIFTSFRQSALPAAYLCYLADIPLRLAASIDAPGSLLTTRHKHPEHLIHEVERGLDLVGAIGMHTQQTDLVLRVPTRERDGLQESLQAHGVPTERPLVMIHPGCTMPARTYPWEMYGEVADKLNEQLGATVVLTGSDGERDLVRRVQGRMRRPAVGLAGQLSFEQFCALVQQADLVITNNTGPMHVAAALKTPVVALFALTNPPEQWGPWRVPHRLLNHDVPCRICYSRICPYEHECLRGVSPPMVADAAADLLAAAEDAPSKASLVRPLEEVHR